MVCEKVGQLGTYSEAPGREGAHPELPVTKQSSDSVPRDFLP